MQVVPSTWRTEAAAAPGSPDDPYRPLDAMTVAGSYLRRIELGAAGGGQHDLRGALAVNLLVVVPIPAPGWVQRVPTPPWPATPTDDQG
jgi:hypothetical protein